ncbi:MAG: hypothetical protein FE041_03385 [Thermoplasmata archaeon]|nr:MAG: hypothetical protein FE041_03385 [Thermoplasmata archaeon]
MYARIIAGTPKSPANAGKIDDDFTIKEVFIFKITIPKIPDKKKIKRAYKKFSFVKITSREMQIKIQGKIFSSNKYKLAGSAKINLNGRRRRKHVITEARLDKADIAIASYPFPSNSIE